MDASRLEDQRVKSLRARRSAGLNEPLAMEGHDLTTVEEVAAAVDVGKPRRYRQPESTGWLSLQGL